MNTIRIGHRDVGAGAPVMIIAEAGINHDGNIEKAAQLVHAAAGAGADVIKFQTHLAEHEMLDVSARPVYLEESLFQLIKRVELSVDDHRRLMAEAEKAGIMFLSTPFSVQAIDLLDAMNVPAFKVGSGELNNTPFITHLASKGRPVILSTGMSSFEEVAESVAILKNGGCDLVLCQCTSEYPTPPEDVQLGVIRQYEQAFAVPVGFSDHSAHNYCAFAAVALGAKLVEKHFTLSRDWPGPDQSSSIEPHELKDLVTGIRSIEKALQGAGKCITADEEGIRAIFNASVVAVRDIAAGEILTKDNIWVKRPGGGIPARELYGIIGKKAANVIRRDTIVCKDDIAG